MLKTVARSGAATQHLDLFVLLQIDGDCISVPAPPPHAPCVASRPEGLWEVACRRAVKKLTVDRRFLQGKFLVGRENVCDWACSFINFFENRVAGLGGFTNHMVVFKRFIYSLKSIQLIISSFKCIVTVYMLFQEIVMLNILRNHSPSA